MPPDQFERSPVNWPEIILDDNNPLVAGVDGRTVLPLDLRQVASNLYKQLSSTSVPVTLRRRSAPATVATHERIHAGQFLTVAPDLSPTRARTLEYLPDNEFIRTLAPNATKFDQIEERLVERYGRAWQWEIPAYRFSEQRAKDTQDFFDRYMDLMRRKYPDTVVYLEANMPTNLMRSYLTNQPLPHQPKSRSAIK